MIKKFAILFSEPAKKAKLKSSAEEFMSVLNTEFLSKRIMTKTISKEEINSLY
jgi:hypothetical protein